MTNPLRFTVLRPDGTQGSPVARAVACESAIAIEINGIGYAVMMATPHDLEDFVVGFCLAEQLISHAGQIETVDVHAAEEGAIVRVRMSGAGSGKILERARQRVSEGSCGLCGLESLEQVMRPLVPVSARLAVETAAIFRALSLLPAHQPANAATGAMHAAAFCAPTGEILVSREDVGRHNALDKLLGALARAGVNPATGFLLLTARCSFELVQKAVIANCPLLVTVSAATSLALAQAQAHGLTLISLARADAALLGHNPEKASAP